MWWMLAACSPDPLLREQVELQVDGQTERWQLRWRSPPELACEGGDSSCPCHGFEVAERGELDLVRIRASGEREVLPLTPLFEDGALLRRWLPAEDDLGLHPDELRVRLARRPIVPALRLADYDHDGRAAEFVLQVAAFGCGIRQAVLVGLQRDGRLGVYGGETPILREPETWAGLLSAPTSERLESPCGDHGSDVEVTARLRATPGGLQDEVVVRPCAP
jgi:hypothetical protein